MSTEHHHHDDRQHLHDHSNDHDHGHSHNEHGGPFERIRHVVAPHSHDSADRVDSAMESSQEGMRVLWVSFCALLVTAELQAGEVAVSGSVALLGDTLHNAADALTAVPLGVAFVLGRRAATRRYTYGFGRAEDIAGIVIVITIAASSAAAAYEALERLMHPQPVANLPIVALAALIASPATSSWRAIGSEPAAASAPRRWWPTVCTRTPTDSPRWRCCSRRVPRRSVGDGRTRWSGSPSRSRSPWC